MMRPRRVFINGQLLRLAPSRLIQSGGEGMVFGVGDRAVKLYHHPRPRHGEKLDAFWQQGLAGWWPPGVLGPERAVTDFGGTVIGFEMRRLPPGALPFRRLGSPPFWLAQSLTLGQVVALLEAVHRTLTRLHQQQLVVGDLNDRNLFFAPLAHWGPPSDGGPPPAAGLPPIYWLDVDSFQIGQHPCPVALIPFLDPDLYAVADFSLRPVFSQASDWYAFFVLLVRSVLQVHPYGGAHPGHKTVRARAAHRLSILQPTVTYPHNARPVEILSDDMLHHLGQVFDQGVRVPFPAQLLQAYAADLRRCPHCGQEYPRRRAGCPVCRRPAPVPRPVTQERWRTLLGGVGYLALVRVLPDGRMAAVARQGEQYHLYRLGVGGRYDRLALFNGGPGARLALFAPPDGGLFLAANPPGSAQLLLLDVTGRAPRPVTTLATARFRDQAVFAATPRHLVRIAGGWIIRTTVRDGMALEEPIATAHQRQTSLWASPYTETVAGVHRLFAELRTFLWHAGAAYDVSLPPVADGVVVRQAGVRFGPHGLACWRRTGPAGRPQTETVLVDLAGRVGRRLAGAVPHFPFTLDPGQAGWPLRLLPADTPLPDGARVLAHPGGVVVAGPQAIYFAAA